MRPRTHAIALLTTMVACSPYADEIASPVDVRAWIPSPAATIPGEREITAPGIGAGDPGAVTPAQEKEDRSFPVDLATALRLAGAKAI